MAIGKRREFEVFTLSFLDCICCGFGAIILLLVLTDIGQPIVIERGETISRGRSSICNASCSSCAAKPTCSIASCRAARRCSRSNSSGRRCWPEKCRRSAASSTPARARLRSPTSWRPSPWPAHQTLTAEMQRLLRTRRGAIQQSVGGRHSGRQRIHHLRHRHLRQHAGRQLGERPECHEGNSRHLPDRERACRSSTTRASPCSRAPRASR